MTEFADVTTPPDLVRTAPASLAGIGAKTYDVLDTDVDFDEEDLDPRAAHVAERDGTSAPSRPPMPLGAMGPGTPQPGGPTGAPAGGVTVPGAGPGGLAGRAGVVDPAGTQGLAGAMGLGRGTAGFAPTSPTTTTPLAPTSATASGSSPAGMAGAVDAGGLRAADMGSAPATSPAGPGFGSPGATPATPGSHTPQGDVAFDPNQVVVEARRWEDLADKLAQLRAHAAAASPASLRYGFTEGAVKSASLGLSDKVVTELAAGVASAEQMVEALRASARDYAAREDANQTLAAHARPDAQE